VKNAITIGLAGKTTDQLHVPDVKDMIGMMIRYIKESNNEGQE